MRKCTAVTGNYELFELFYIKETVGQIAAETNCYVHQYNNSKRNFFSERSWISEWKPFIEYEIYHHSSTIHADTHFLKPSLGMHFSCNQLVATTTFDSIISLHLFQSSCIFLHFSENSTKGK
jgi:hypothetical protein